MRIGNAFSQILDPTRQPLFDGAGCEAPLPDEGWPGIAPDNHEGVSVTLCACSLSPSCYPACFACMNILTHCTRRIVPSPDEQSACHS